MHARERRNASLALLVDGVGLKLCRRCHWKPAATAKMKESLAVQGRIQHVMVTGGCRALCARKRAT